MSEDEEIFRPFRPYCAILTSQHNPECLEQLRKLCDQTGEDKLDRIQEYLMFPAQLHLKTKAKASPQNYTVSMLEYITALYKRIQLSSFFILKDVLSSCLALVTVTNKDSTSYALLLATGDRCESGTRSSINGGTTKTYSGRPYLCINEEKPAYKLEDGKRYEIRDGKLEEK